jgi:pimeloyl-ACP methyl ester carboxylesterase
MRGERNPPTSEPSRRQHLKAESFVTESTPSVRRAYTTSRFGQLHYLEGTPAAETGRAPLILLHQNPSSSEEYRNLLVEMARDRRVIAFDTPGHGMSDGPGGPRPLADLSAAFADGLEAMGLGETPVDVFGFHSGVYLSTELALAKPAGVRRLVLSGIPLRSLEERQARLEEARATPPVTDGGETVIPRLGWLWKFIVTERTPGVPLQRAAEMFVEKAKTLDRYWWVYDGVWSYPAEARLPLVAQPVLVLQPHEVLLEPSRKACGLFPNGTFVDLPSLDRDVFEVGVEDFAREMRRFLD